MQKYEQAWAKMKFQIWNHGQCLLFESFFREGGKKRGRGGREIGDGGRERGGREEGEEGR